MSEMKIKEISTFMDNNIRKTRLVISESSKETEIILEGDGKINVAVKA